MDHRVEADTLALLHEERNERREALIEAIDRRGEANAESGLRYLLVDKYGQRLTGNLDGEPPADDGYEETLAYGKGRLAQAITTLLPDRSRLVVVAADRGAIDAADRIMLRLGGVAIGVTLVLAIAAFWIVSAVTRDRLHRIDTAAQAMIHGDLSHRIHVEGTRNEFDQVSETLNTMLDRIQQLAENLRQVSSDVAHDLRTLLTKLTNKLNQALSAGDAQVREQRIT
ncbi:HAMP domain-containing protein [Xanthomonas axonopodis]